MKITEKESALLLAIRDSYFHDGRDPVGDPVWSQDIEDEPACRAAGLSGKAVGAVMSSLVKKGLVWVDGEGRDAVVAITREGMAALFDVGG